MAGLHGRPQERSPGPSIPQSLRFAMLFHLLPRPHGRRRDRLTEGEGVHPSSLIRSAPVPALGEPGAQSRLKDGKAKHGGRWGGGGGMYAVLLTPRGMNSTFRLFRHDYGLNVHVRRKYFPATAPRSFRTSGCKIPDPDIVVKLAEHFSFGICLKQPLNYRKASATCENYFKCMWVLSCRLCFALSDSLVSMAASQRTIALLPS